ncbi:MAG: NUDIX domain-containing protein [Xanthobacteraceae bacterium]|jgi:8-oxo-dGTP diphosphatase
MKRRKAGEPIHAAGGIVIRGHREPLIAIVQLRKDDSWVLPKGKLNRNESARAAARREVLEEVGHKVYVHEFLGTIAYEVGTRPKVVQFWRMQAIGDPAGQLMSDVKAVVWSKLPDAIERLTHSREQVFLRNVGPVALEAAARSARRERSAEPAVPAMIAEPADDVTDVAALVPTFDPQDAAETSGFSSHQQMLDENADLASGDIVAPVGCSVDEKVASSAAEPPCRDCITSTGLLDLNRIDRRIRLLFGRLALAGRRLAHRAAKWIPLRRPVDAPSGAPGSAKVGVNRHGGHDEAALEGDQEGA